MSPPGRALDSLGSMLEKTEVRTVSFNAMADGTREDYELLDRFAEEFEKGLADRVLAALLGLETSLGGYKVTRLEHSLQSATRAYRDGRSEEYVVATLLHDIGDELAPYNHGEMASAVLRPFVSEECWWIIRHHGVFQLYYYAHHHGGDRNVRDRYRESPYFEACAEFCELYDQTSFDPDYESLPVGFFEPMVQRVFAEPRYLGGEIS
jgi:predicted HD phosphohydrolase